MLIHITNRKEKTRKKVFIKIALFASLLLLTSCLSGNNGGVMVNNKMTPIASNAAEYNGILGQRSLIVNNKTKIHYRPQTGWLGDAHPVYKDGVWYLYYLDLPFNTENRDALLGVRQGLATSRDLINWEEQTPTIDNARRAWWAIGNTFKDNMMYSMFNDVVTNSGYGLAKSSDMLTFSDFGVVYPYSYILGDEPRDPTLFYDETDDLYYFIYAVKNYASVYDNAQGVLYYSTTKDFITFTEPEIFYDPGNANVAECPEVFKMGKYYYLVMNWGTDRVGTARYRISESLKGPWRKPEIDVLHATEFMAPNGAGTSSERVTFGWVPTYRNNEDNGRWQWGGDLALPVTLEQRKDGSLKTRLNINDELIRENQTYEFTKNNYDYVKGDGWHSFESGFAYKEGVPYGEIWLTGEHKYFDFTADVTLGRDNTGVGVSFRTGNRGFNGYEIFIDPVTNQLLLRSHLERRINIVAQPIKIKKGETMKLRIIVDGPIIEAYLNDEFALAGRVHIGATRNAIGLFSEYGGAQFKNIAIYNLKQIY